MQLPISSDTERDNFKFKIQLLYETKSVKYRVWTLSEEPEKWNSKLAFNLLES